eukprot:scaffold32132_cov152-Isochrysis_galbana.AAC.1
MRGWAMPLGLGWLMAKAVLREQGAWTAALHARATRPSGMRCGCCVFGALASFFLTHARSSNAQTNTAAPACSHAHIAHVCRISTCPRLVE